MSRSYGKDILRPFNSNKKCFCRPQFRHLKTPLVAHRCGASRRTHPLLLSTASRRPCLSLVLLAYTPTLGPPLAPWSSFSSTARPLPSMLQLGPMHLAWSPKSQWVASSMDYLPTTSNISLPTRTWAQTPAPLEEAELIVAINSVLVEFLSIRTSEALRGEPSEAQRPPPQTSPSPLKLLQP